MLISGGLGIIGAVIMVLVILGVNSGLDPHGVFGTAAMIVVVIGVHQILAGLSYRRDAKKDSSRS
jgi:hypothetical protein